MWKHQCDREKSRKFVIFTLILICKKIIRTLFVSNMSNLQKMGIPTYCLLKIIIVTLIIIWIFSVIAVAGF